MSMNELSDKSDLNMLSAELLQKSSYYDSVCHPVYYACFQLMSHKLIRKGIDLSQQGSIASSQYGGNSHKAVIKTIDQYLNKTNHSDKILYDKYIKKLKEMRERADYKNVRIKQDESDKCIKMSKFVIQVLNTI